MNTPTIDTDAAEIAITMQKRLRKETAPQHRALLEALLALLNVAVHITLPAWGEVYRGNKSIEQLSFEPTEDEKTSFIALPGPIVSFSVPLYDTMNTVDETIERMVFLMADLHQQYPDSVDPDDYGRVMYVFTKTEGEWHIFHRWGQFPHPEHPTRPFNIRTSPKGPLITLSIYDIDPEKSKEHIAEPEDVDYETLLLGIQSAIQCCHALRAGATLPRKKVAPFSGRQAKYQKHGVAGFDYHVLTIPYQHVTGRDVPKVGAHHASPRFHVRRAHIRKVSEKAFTFVRQCFVGDRSKGVVDKSYRVTKQ